MSGQSTAATLPARRPVAEQLARFADRYPRLTESIWLERLRLGIVQSMPSPAPAARMPRQFVLLLHVGYWALYALLLTLIFAISRTQARPASSPVTLMMAARLGAIFIAPNLLGFYLAYAVLFPRFLARQRFGALLGAALLSAYGCAATAVLLQRILANQAWAALVTLSDIAGLMSWLAVVVLIHMTIALVMRGFVGWYDDIAVKQQLRQKTSEVEAALVRAKLDPHFLFNTLNNIDVLITRDPLTASLYLNKLCDIMRFVLYEASAERIPLASELEYIDRYIALERIRSTSVDFVTCTVTGDPTRLTIAPMLLIPFIENAFKHAEGQRMKDAIVITCTVNNTELTFQCSNRHANDGGLQRTIGGLGNSLMRERLSLLYPARHTLDVTNHDHSYTITLTVDLDDRALHHR